MGSLKLKKHVICEKLMCLKICEAKEIVKFSKITKKVYVVMQNKFNTPVVKLMKDIKKKDLVKFFMLVLLGDGEGIKVITISINGEVLGNMMVVLFLTKPVIILIC